MYYTSNEIYAGFIRSVGGWDRFTDILEKDLPTADNNKDKLLAFSRKFIRVKDTYVIDEFISHNKKEIESYIVSLFSLLQILSYF